MVQKKNDERQSKACQRGKKRQSKSLLLVRLPKKRLGEMGLSEMRLGEMLPNRRHSQVCDVLARRTPGNDVILLRHGPIHSRG